LVQIKEVADLEILVC